MATFDTLPLEILFRVLDSVSSPHDSISSSFHPLNSLAAANKHFDSAVEEYTRVLLKQHANFAPKKKSKTYINRKKWLAETCQLCYKTSKRRSTLWSVLTCCLTCDKKHFPKVTMTNAINQHKLSKLDLFTPNRLHPTLPSLSHGEYPVMGGVATMIYEPDLVARGDYLHGLLGLLDHTDNSTARRRVRRHDLLMMHMEVAYSTARKIWYRKSPSLREEGKAPAVRKSMETRESRDAFVRDALASERASLHSQGASEDTAIELD
ncbi:uncharacterized protein M421DRAFT_425245 [Didymella exigua CBS 183.55]|uniref:Uncharacterized protein n=1 Tax=Didymella exigua CBS 183.55 TaxID=1150837 RepID=A0A6A5R8G8_9PLEO|nr:uncharacterized protein M421DRAFT_425245 [Didymella exigua CBS 183.55]KAF1923913.1 hypothetical protein M421DRAFT_425245 [Didymella exigua CBS 183.55]